MAEPRKCDKCSKNLHGATVGDTCRACRGGASPAPEGGGGQRKPRADVVKRFRVVAGALGVDPDALVAEFCEGWLERVRSSVKFGTDA